MENCALSFPGYSVIFKVFFSPLHKYVLSPEMTEEQARKGCPVKTTGKCSMDKVFCIARRGLHVHTNPSAPVRLVVLARCRVGKCATVSIKALGDFLKKSFTELQIFKKAILDESFLCCTSLCLSPSPPR